MAKRLRWFLLSVLGFIPVQIYLIIGWLPRFLEFSAGLPNLDSRFSYTPAEVDQLLSLLGDSGIRHYVLGTGIDFLYAVLMGLVVFTLMRLAMGNVVIRNAEKTISLAIPILYVVSDWVENFGILKYLIGYPAEAGPSVSFFSAFSTFKQISPVIALLFLGYVLIRRVVARLSRK